MEILQCRSECGGAADGLRAGDLVRVREGVWRVMEVRTFAQALRRPFTRPFAQTRVLRLIGADALNRWQPCTLMEPFDRPRRVEAVAAPRVVSRARWMRTCAASIAASPPAECPSTIADARVTLMPHQIDPVLAVLRGRASRLMLADAVGLGKTIQAALLVRELRARGCADRVLILVPSGLRDQWRQELSHRAGLRADIIDAAALAARTRELPPDINPWSLPGILIVSLDFIKQPSVLRGAGAILRDLLIVDEAHNLNEGTDRLAAADLLARHSRHVVLLTATPHHGSDDAFNTLCRIGQITDGAASGGVMSDGDTLGTSRSDPIIIFRRTRETLGMTRTRKVHVLRVTPTKQERRLHTLLSRYVGRVERDERDERENVSIADGGASRQTHTSAASLAMSVLLKRASSSAASLERSLRRRLALLDANASSASDHPSPQRQPQPLLPFGDEDDDDLADGEPSHILGAPGLRSARVERAWLTLLIEASRNAARAESKPRALTRFLRRCREPVLIYTEYRDTLTHLARTLLDSSRHAVSTTSAIGSAADQLDTSLYALLHGGLGADARRAALARFTSGDARILLTTDAAGEGLNLHHRCRLVINVELPWNPNRLEQRIGRVDRLGQTRTVHAIHLVAAGAAEEQMLTRLTGRVERIAATLGDAPAVLAAAVRDAGASGASGASEVRADDAIDPPGDAIMPRDDARGACRSVSAMAADVTAQLQLLRNLQTRAWRPGRRHVDAIDAPARPGREMPASRSDPLLALDEGAPAIAITRRRRRPTCPVPGLLCLWCTRVHRDDGRVPGRARPPSNVLAVTHIACDVPRLPNRAAIAAFVTTTIEQCHARIQPLLDREVAAARERVDVAERARIERLARRDDAIEAALAATLRARADGNGWLQPLLFEDIASERATMAGRHDESYRTWTGEPAAGAPEQPNEQVQTVQTDQTDQRAQTDQTDQTGQTSDRLTPSLAMVLVVR